MQGALCGDQPDPGEGGHAALRLRDRTLPSAAVSAERRARAGARRSDRAIASDAGRRTGALTAGTLAQNSVRILGCRVDRVDMAGALAPIALLIEAGRVPPGGEAGARMGNPG